MLVLLENKSLYIETFLHKNNYVANCSELGPDDNDLLSSRGSISMCKHKLLELFTF